MGTKINDEAVLISRAALLYSIVKVNYTPNIIKINYFIIITDLQDKNNNNNNNNMSLQRLSILFLTALVVSVRSFTVQQQPLRNVVTRNDNKNNARLAEPISTTTSTTTTTALNIYGSYGYGRGWDYDFGNLNYGTDTYRQRYNDGYSGGVNLSYNGYSQQTNVARRRGRVAPYSSGGYYGYGGNYDDWDDFGYGGYGRNGYGRNGYGSRGGGYYGGGNEGGYGGYGGYYGRGYNNYDDYYGRGKGNQNYSWFMVHG
jgi:hypothetical protein